MRMHGDVAERYRDFARHARSASPCFEAWALGVAEDPQVLAWLADLPRIKQQPNLVFAAARWHGAPAPSAYAALREVLLQREEEVKATIRARSTQTNEAGRLATLLPAFARVAADGTPLALLEVGASAGLCLFPDRYDYRWHGKGELAGSGGPVLTTRAEGPVPVPGRLPAIGWRGGLDLNPLDVRDADTVAWLETLVWPEEDDRRARLHTAVAMAREDPPRIRRGDLLTDLDPLLDEASGHGTPVVFHTAVAAYLDLDERERFDAAMRERVAAERCHWVSNEAPHVLPAVTATGPEVPDVADWFVLGVDGRAVAWTGGHGQALRWW